jgi:Family of unknown function (DUF6609)
VEHPVLRPSHRYPMLRAGGLFLILIGVGLIGAIAFSGDALINYNVFFAGAAAGIVSLFFAGRLSTGRPARLQVLALAAAILLEGPLFVAMGRTLPPGTAEHVRWLWASAIVGVHFLPMSICFGPRFAVLGVACIANAALGLLASAVPYEFFGLVDGALKVGFGIVSFLDS